MALERIEQDEELTHEVLLSLSAMISTNCCAW